MLGEEFEATILRISEGQAEATLCAQPQDAMPTNSSASSVRARSTSPGASDAQPSVWTPAACSTPEVDEDEFATGDEEASGSSTDSEAFTELEDPGGTEVVFVKEGVAVWPSRTERILGRLSLVKQHCVLFMAWLPYSRGTLQGDGTFLVTAVSSAGAGSSAAGRRSGGGSAGSSGGAAASSGSGRPGAHDSSGARTLYAVHPIPLSEVQALRKHTPTLGWHSLVVVLANGVTLPPLYFHNGGIKALINTLKQHVPLFKSADDSNTYLVNDVADPLCRSLTSLQLSDVLIGAPPLGASATFQFPAPVPASAAGAAGDAMNGHHEGASGRDPAQGLDGAATAHGHGHRPVGLGLAAGLGLSASLAVGSGFGLALGPGPAVSWSWADQPPGAGDLHPWRGISTTIADAITKLMQGVRGTTSSWLGALDPDGGAQEHLQDLELPAAGADAGGGSAGGSAGGSPGSGSRARRAPVWGEHAAQGGGSPSAEAGQPGGAASRREQQQQQVSRQASDGAVVLVPCCEFGAVLCDASSAGHTLQAPALPTAACDRRVLQMRPMPDPSTLPQPAGYADGSNSPASPALPEEQPQQQQQQQGQPAEAMRACTEVGDFELLEPDERPAGPPRRRPRPPPLSAADWSSMFDGEGRLVADAPFYDRVFAGGCEEGVRREVWKHLLGMYPKGSTAQQRAELAKKWRSDYQGLKAQWCGMLPNQEAHNAKWRERRARIDKDVRRTDRGHAFFSREGGPHLRALRSVLLTYAMYNFDLGYCQGMSDLAAPLLVVMRGDEAEAFWAFVAVMERLQGNFDHDQQGMTAQLTALRKLVQLLDPQLHACFERRDCLNYFFAFRWLLIHFKREFKFDDVLRLWESMWACRSTRHLHLYFAVAVLVHHRRMILLHEQQDFDGMLKLCIDLSGNLDLLPTLELAEVLVGYAGAAGQEVTAGLP